MSLAAVQKEFLVHVLDEDRALPSGWTPRHAAGLDIYRNNYRSSLMEALKSSYERTERYVGEDAFSQAAAHHVISRPPNSWTLDAAGEGFAETLADLFADDPDVAELAWLEAAMTDAFVAADAEPLGAAGFAAATAEFGEGDWAAMKLELLPGTAIRPVAFDVATLWRGLSGGEHPGDAARLAGPACLLVWREGYEPVFRLVDAAEGELLGAILSGETYSEACGVLFEDAGDDAAAQAGAMFGRWLHDGLVASVSLPSARG
ncbi:DNA-binding domain-containing protein [Erythrobacter sp. HKB08]|uniref:HvfC/BufC N-terminal domain-containing protein n=1 Tax=Erythrobacter sp. HKB08 TaxID=2502843 RepID=UPI001008DE16|nr:DNA-binding domain-containing protein [Erythrobacter sp. HKB08]